MEYNFFFIMYYFVIEMEQIRRIFRENVFLDLIFRCLKILFLLFFKKDVIGKIGVNLDGLSFLYLKLRVGSFEYLCVIQWVNCFFIKIDVFFWSFEFIFYFIDWWLKEFFNKMYRVKSIQGWKNEIKKYLIFFIFKIQFWFDV